MAARAAWIGRARSFAGVLAPATGGRSDCARMADRSRAPAVAAVSWAPASLPADEDFDRGLEALEPARRNDPVRDAAHGLHGALEPAFGPGRHRHRHGHLDAQPPLAAAASRRVFEYDRFAYSAAR